MRGSSVGTYILTEDHNPVPVDTMTWAKWRDEDFEGRCRVGADTIGDYRVSTVFLGLDHAYGNGPPKIFETMVFSGEESDLLCGRYSTWTEADAGHRKVVEALTRGERPGEIEEDTP